MLQAKENSSTDFLEKTVGKWGRWQLFVVIAVFLVKFPIAFHQLNIVFVAPHVDYGCEDNVTEACSKSCSGYIYDRSVFTETIITQWNLVCEKTQLANLAQTVTMLGILVGNMLFGVLSDRFGRKAPLTWAVIIQVVGGVGSALVPWLWVFMVLRFICSTATGGTMTTSFVIVMEAIGAKHRTTVGILYQIPFNLGHATLALIAYFVRDWRVFQLVISLPSIILISYYWILPESPTWLLAMGRTKETVKILKKGAKFNNLPTDDIQAVVESAYRNQGDKSTKQAGNVLQLFKSPVMRTRTICISFSWISCGFCFYGVAQFMGNLAGNIFINVALSGLVQIPGTIFTCWFINAIGRRNTMIVSNGLGGLSCLLISCVPDGVTWAKTLLACMGMFWLVSAFGAVYVYSGELLPTTHRNAGIGFASLTARIGSMIAPFVAGLYTLEQWLPPIFFGVVPIIAAGLCFFLPETKNCALPDTIEEAEDLMFKYDPATEMTEKK